MLNVIITKYMSPPYGPVVHNKGMPNEETFDHLRDAETGDLYKWCKLDRAWIKVPDGQATIDRIKAVVSAEYCVSISDMESVSRDATVVRARHVAMYRCHGEGIPLTMIGKAFNRSHATVSHAIKKVFYGKK